MVRAPYAEPVTRTLGGVALALAALGYWVFPLWPNGKTPLLSKKNGAEGYKDATTDPGQIRRWWNDYPNANVGIAAGLSGLLCPDLDVKNGEDGPGEYAKLVAGLDLPDPVVVTTASGGFHYYYRGHAGSTAGIRPGVDVRSDGGYVVAPGSVVNGKRYEGDLPRVEDLPEAPEALRVLLIREKGHGVTGSVIGRASVGEILTKPPTEGSRNQELAKLCGHYAPRFDSDEKDFYLATINTLVKDWGLPVEEVEKTAESIWHRERVNRAEVLPAIAGNSLQAIFAGTEDFWNARPSLQLIRQAAIGRQVTPWPTLGAAAVMVLARISPDVVLPPIVGGVASLNSFVALVGPSGAGKGASEAVARDLLGLEPGELTTLPIGSGEGISKAFATKDAKTGIQTQHETRVLFTASEVDTLTAINARGGSTTSATLRKMWSGEQLGAQNADNTRAVILDPHSYRACFITGVQPGRAEGLLNDADGGTPQRFLWFPVLDPTLTDEEWTSTQWTGEILSIGKPWDVHFGQTEIPLPESVIAGIKKRRADEVRGKVAVMGGHAQLTRLKFAVALAIMDGREHVDEEDWRLAGVVLEVSNRTRAWMQEQLAESQRTEAQKKGKIAGVIRESAVESAKREKIQLTQDKILAHVDGAGRDGILKSELVNRKFDSETRPLARELVESMLASVPPLLVEYSDRGSAVRLTR
ncbi:bifunctional DNA primase/polymerase [Pseudarthrobacter sp. HLT3-5]|uniref:bifunctional DNA primase/polymerase n=1 Tax=Pseudarthrobacter cellobiosi TaxID=2953654 RepID=UPI00208F4098|nr:bifunctional DNA primase/polymerase [Pseudarthrobacter sp. HLT3-5]MCO4276716.1 bifunctional DNA primase/polymerase [Pseudarthrobacter sp. HLT3-5]